MIWVNAKEQRWKGKRMFARETPESTDAKETWSWLRKAELIIQSLLCAALEQTLRSNFVKHHIDSVERER